MTVHNEVSGGRLLLLFSVSLAESRIAVEVPFPGEPVNVNNLLTINYKLINYYYYYILIIIIMIAKGPSTRSTNSILFWHHTVISLTTCRGTGMTQV